MVWRVQIPSEEARLEVYGSIHPEEQYAHLFFGHTEFDNFFGHYGFCPNTGIILFPLLTQ